MTWPLPKKPAAKPARVRTRHLEFQAARRSTSSTASAAWAKACRSRSRQDGRRILWLAHESAPKNFTAVDVTDPRKPKIVVQTDLPQSHMRSNSLETGRRHDGGRLPDARRRDRSRPASSCSTSRCRRTRSRSRSSTARARTRAACTSSGSATASTSTCARARRDFEPTHPLDDQFYRCSTCAIRRSRSRSAAGGMPGTRKGDNVPPPPRHAAATTASARTTPTSIRSGRTAAISAISTAACSSSTSPTRRTRRWSRRWTNSPPYTGFTHTVVPLFDRGLMLVTDESTEDNAKDWPKLIWILDAREETQPGADRDLPAAADHDAFKRPRRPLRRAQHPRERAAADLPGSPTRSCSAPSSTAACAPTTSPIPYQPKEVALSCRRRRRWRPTGTIQLNDVFVDERGIVFTVDRHVGGLYMLEMDF